MDQDLHFLVLSTISLDFPVLVRYRHWIPTPDTNVKIPKTRYENPTSPEILEQVSADNLERFLSVPWPDFIAPNSYFADSFLAVLVWSLPGTR